jgi:hypothetical protein
LRKRPKRGVSLDPVGYDAGKNINGIKRNALVDTEGHLLSLEVIPGHIQDRDSAAGLIERALQKYPRGEAPTPREGDEPGERAFPRHGGGMPSNSAGERAKRARATAPVEEDRPAKNVMGRAAARRSR